MKYKYLIAFALIFTAIVVPHSAYAQEAGASAGLKPQIETSRIVDAKIKENAIKNVLADYASPLIGEAEAFVTTARALGLDPYLLPAIAGVESGFGQRYLKHTNNVFGFGVGRIPFDNFADGIARVGYALRFKYINRGAQNLAQIGHMYAGGSTTWAPKVQRYISAFEREEMKLRRFALLSS